MYAIKYPFITLVLFIYGYGQSQDFLPMLEADHVWNTKYTSCPDPCYDVYSEYVVGGESTFNGEVYQELIVNGVGTRFVREDNGKIYQYFQSTNEEFLILDFTLEVGDMYTFPPPYQSNDIQEMWLAEITMEEIAGELRKVLYFDECQGCGFILESWIEGIGSNNALFPGGNNFIDSGSDLACFTKNAITYFFNGNSVCFEVAGIDDFGKNDVVLSPNPVTTVSLLQFSSEGLADTVHILDIFGRVISEEKVQGDQIMITSDAYRSGIYFYQVFSEKQLLKTEKFIIH